MKDFDFCSENFIMWVLFSIPFSIVEIWWFFDDFDSWWKVNGLMILYLFAIYCFVTILIKLPPYLSKKCKEYRKK